MTADSTKRSPLSFIVESTLRSYASIIFMNKAWHGAVILLISFLDPKIAIGGMIGAVSANLLAAAFRYPEHLVRAGIYGISPLLVGISFTYFGGLTPAAVLYIIPASWLTLFVSVLVNDRLFVHYKIGSLSTVFALVALVSAYAIKPSTYAAPTGATDPVSIFFSSLGAVFFMPRVEFGIVLFALIALFSRINLILAVAGFVVGSSIYLALGGTPNEIAYGMVGMNFILTAIAVGGFFLEAGPASTIHALAATVLTCFVSLLLVRVLAPLGLPVFSLPFNVASIAWIAAMALRPANAVPKLNAICDGSPEEMLSRAQLVSRISLGVERLRLPFLGEWTVTQGIDGKPTHQRPWDQCLDFEVLDRDGFPFRREASESRMIAPEDYYCFGAPVLAAEDGAVVAAVAGIEDNAPGASNIRDNFGNHVILRHRGFCTVYAHLKQHSVLVAPGMQVRRGHVIGKCGSSGRSPRPHLHFHAQADAALGGATVPFEFTSYFSAREAGAAPTYHERGVPEEFHRVASLDSAAVKLPSIALPAHAAWNFAVRSANRTRIESWRIAEDLYGGITVASDAPEAEATWHLGRDGWKGTSFRGAKTAMLRILFLGIAKAPPKLAPNMAWNDELHGDLYAFSMKRMLAQALVPFFGAAPRPVSFAVDSASTEEKLIIVARGDFGTITTEWAADKGLLHLAHIDAWERSVTATRLEA